MTERILSEITPLFGFCPFEKISGRLLDCRAKARIPEKAETVIVCAFPYYLGADAYEGSDISKYAVVPDYHDVVGELLRNACQKLGEKYPEAEFEPFTDNSPVPEVYAAVNAGLGVTGKNGLLITEKYGSWVFIGEIITTKKYNRSVIHETDCIGCGRCIKSCPTGSITEKGINKESCLSDITQKKGELSDREKQLITESGCIWGCDICQNVCPMNSNPEASPLLQFRNDVKLKADAENLIGRAYAWRGKKVIERNINILYKEKNI